MGLPAYAFDPAEDTSKEEGARRHPRASVSLTIGLSTEHNFWSGITMNVSEGGVFVATHQVAAVGTVVSLTLFLPGRPEPLTALGEVRWTRPYGGNDDVPPGLGVRFLEIDHAALDAVRHFVESVRDPLYFET